MKKLLSAVTSAVMSASLMSGAFTSSVSAAGSFAAAQPNVSMGGVLDVAANKTAGEDVVFDFGNYTADAGSSVIVNVKVDTQGKAVSAMDVRFKVDSPLKVSEIVEESPAFNTTVMTNLSNLGANFKSLDSKGEPMTPVNEPVFQFVVDIPAGTPSGEYKVGFGDKCEVHKSNDGSKYTTSYTNGVITVKGTNDTPSTTASTSKSNTSSNTTVANTTAQNTSSTPTQTSGTPSAPSKDGEVMFDFQNYNVKAGDTFIAEVLVDTKGKAVSAMDVKFKIDSPLKITEIVEESPAFNTTVMTNMAILGANFKSLASNGDPMVPTSDPVFQLAIEVPSNTPDGVYHLGFNGKNEVHKSNDGSKYTAGYKNGAITVGSSNTSSSSQPTHTQTSSSNSTPTQTTDPVADADVVFDFQNYNVKAGDTFIAEVLVDSKGKPISAMDVKFKLDSPLKVTEIVEESPAFNTTVMTNMAILGANFKSLASNGDPMVPTSDPVFQLAIEVPSNTPDGVYHLGFNGKNEVHKSNDGSQYTVASKNGTITVGSSVVSSSTTSSNSTPTQTTSNTPAKSGEVVFDFGNYNANPGDDVTVGVTVDTAGQKVAAMDVVFKIDSPLIIKEIVEESPAFNTTAMTNLKVLGINFKSLDSNSDPMLPISGQHVFDMVVSVPASTPAGSYHIGFGDKKEVVKDNSNAQYNVSEINGKINVGVGTTVTSAVTQSATSATSVTSATSATSVTSATSNESAGTTTTVKSTPATGSASWVIPTVKAKPGEKVTMNVVVKDSAIEVAGAQFNIKQTAPIAFDSAATGNAYAPVVPNDKEQYYAFGEGIGKGVKAADGSTIITLTFNVPADCANGTYPVKWSNAFITDTNGNKITDKITLTDGAIVVGDTPVAEGTAEWVIPTVNAKPGEKVTMNVVVKDSAVEVAGAQFNIKQTAPITYGSSATGNAYAAIVPNDTEQYYAFGEGIGKGIKAADGATIITLTFNVPADCAKGTYPVKWSNAFITDTNGNKITDKIKLTDGAIVIGDTPVTEDGTAEWVIPTVNAMPGETVTMDVVVKNSAAEVAGAQFNIKQTAPIGYSKSATGNAYAEIVPNDTEQYYAFGEGIGKGVKATEGAKIITLTFTVPADCADGTYPVKWSNAFITDTNGKKITDNIKLTDGAIIVSKDTTTSTTNTTSASNDDTSASTTSTTVSSPDISTSSEDATTTTTPVTSPRPTDVSLPSGAIGWKVGTTEAKPGDVVTLSVEIIDTNNVKLPVAGASFTVVNEGDIQATGVSEDKNGYNSNVIYNPTTHEFAFAEGTGKNVASEDGKIVANITYKISDTCKAGEYPVDLGGLKVYDTEGNDITKYVIPFDGFIKVVIDTETPTTTTTTTVDGQTSSTTSTTVSDGQTSSTTSTTVDGQTSSTTSTTVSGGQTSSTTSTTVDGQTSATTTTTLPKGSVIWQGETVKAKPGDTVKVKFTIEDSGSGLPVAGAQFTVKSPIGNGKVDDKLTNGYGASVVANPTENEYAFANPIGAGIASENGKTVIELEFAVPSNCEAGEYVVDIDNIKVFDSNGNDISDRVFGRDGKIIVEDVPGSTTSTTVDGQTSSTTSTTVDGQTSSTTSTTVSGGQTSSTTSTTVDGQTSATTTTTLPKGSVIWQGETVKAKPGDTVKVKFTIEDSGSGLPVAGAQFTVKSPIGNGKVDDKLTNGYGASVVANPTENEYAFANPIGAGIASENGKTVIELEFAVPSNCEAGEYVVDIDNIKVFDSNGNDISDRVFGRDGKIIVEDVPGSTTSTTVDGQTSSTTSTTVDGQTSATTTTTVDGQTSSTTSTTVDGQTSSTTSTTVDGQTSSTTSTTVDGQTSSTTSTTVDGQTSSTTSTTVSGGQTSSTTSTTVSDGQTSSTTSTTVSDGQTSSTTSTTVSGGQTSSTTSTTVSDGQTSSTTSTTVSDGQTSSTTSTTVSDGQTSSTTTTTSGPVGPDTGTTETVTQPIVTGNELETYYTIETVPGYYFSHDTGIRGKGEPGGFDKSQVTKLTKYTVDKNGTVVGIEDLSLDNVNYNGYTPSKAYHDRFGTPAQNPTDQTIENFANNFAYDIPVYYGTEQLKNQNGKPLTVKAYIGVKGDTNLDFIVDGRDASATLTYYARVSTDDHDEKTTAISPAAFVTGPDDPLDDLSAFLSDVNANEWSPENWKLAREERILDGRDASGILTFYARASAQDGEYADLDDQQLWDTVVPERHDQ